MNRKKITFGKVINSKMSTGHLKQFKKIYPHYDEEWIELMEHIVSSSTRDESKKLIFYTIVDDNSNTISLSRKELYLLEDKINEMILKL